MNGFGSDGVFDFKSSAGNGRSKDNGKGAVVVGTRFG